MFRVECQLPFSSWPVRIPIMTTCVGNFLIRAYDRDMNNFLSNEAISIAVRDFFKIYFSFRCKVSFNKYYSLNYLSIV